MCQAELMNQALLQARKVHECSECGSAIPPKTRYVRQVTKYEGDVATHKYCVRCWALCIEGDTGGDACIPFGEVRAYVRENMIHSNTWKELRAKLRARVVSILTTGKL
jgi:hypothetical protein